MSSSKNSLRAFLSLAALCFIAAFLKLTATVVRASVSSVLTAARLGLGMYATIVLPTAGSLALWECRESTVLVVTSVAAAGGGG